MNEQSPKTPKNTRIYAIGDVHGRLDLLDQLLGQIDIDAKTGPNLNKILVMMGDYIDRGPDSQGVISRLDDLKNARILDDFTVHFLKGNHEDSMMSFLANQDKASWLAFGGVQTVLSYGLNPKQNPDTLRALFLKALPKTHREILRTLKFCISIGDYGFAHAGVRPGVAWNNQDPNDLLWIRAEFLKSKDRHDRMIVHGHSPSQDPIVLPNRIGIDTEAWSSNTLTCLILEDDQRRFLST